MVVKIDSNNTNAATSNIRNSGGSGSGNPGLTNTTSSNIPLVDAYIPAPVNANNEAKKTNSFWGNIRDLARNIYVSILGEKVAEAREEIKECKKIIRDVDERLQNGNLAGADKVKLEEVKNKATARVKELSGMIKGEKNWSVRVEYAHEVNELKKYASDESLAEYLRANMASRKELIKSATPQETKDNIKYILQESKELGEIVNSIKNDYIRESLLSELAENNNFMAKQIADKILPPENASETDYVNAAQFAADIFRLPIFTMLSDITQAVLDKIQENNEMNRKADDLAYEKKLVENKEQKSQELKVAIRKSTEKLSILRHYAEKLVAVSEDEKQKVLANILEQLNKKSPIVG